MKKIILGILILILNSTRVKSQTDKMEVNAMMPGDNSVNLYYGYSLSNSLVKFVTGGAAFGITTSVTGPLGIVYEHMVTDVIGLGGEVGYQRLVVRYDENYGNFNNIRTYHSQWTFTTIRIMMRANFHFAKSEKFDAYGFANAGYKSRTVDYSGDDPFASELLMNTAIPLGMKIGLGLRFFFTKNVGIHMEMAAGTPLLCGGLSFKF